MTDTYTTAHILDEAVRAANLAYCRTMDATDDFSASIRSAIAAAIPYLSAPCATKPVDVAAVRKQAFEEGFENGVEQSLNALNAYDDITRIEAEQSIRILKPDYRALSTVPAQETGCAALAQNTEAGQ